MDRADWAGTRQQLLEIDPVNKSRLDELETALFCVCLEDSVPENQHIVSNELLHGDSGNRWFDKSISLIVFGDGSSGINGEHCGLDGTAVVAFIDGMYSEDAAEGAASLGATEQGVTAHRRLEFVLDDAIKQKIEDAAQSFTEYAKNVVTQMYLFENFGGSRIKELKMSPDAFAQLSYQLAHKRSKGFNGATYESIATREYSYGRTEAMRVITPEIISFVEAVENPSLSKEDKIASAQAAATKHITRAKECQSGKAPEQHLWELDMINTRRGKELGVNEELDFFTSPGWIKLRSDYLSTSSSPSINANYFGFGATSPQCIGVGYSIAPDEIKIYFSTHSSVAAEMHKFSEELTKAFLEMEQLLGSNA